MNAWASARIIFIKASLLLNDLLLCQRMWSPVQQFGIAICHFGFIAQSGCAFCSFASDDLFF